MSPIVTDLLPDFLLRYWPALVSGALVSLKFLAWAIAIGFPVGMGIAVIQLTGPALLRLPVIALVEMVRNTPLLVQLWWIHFAIPLLFGARSSPEVSAAIGLALSSACYFSENIRGGLLALPEGQREAATALGIGRWCLWTRILLPQAVIDTLPASANTVLSFFKATSILSVIAVPELMMTAMRISSRTADPIGVLTTMTLIYAVLGGVIAYALRRLEAGLMLRSRP